MLKKAITYKDFNGKEITEEFCFNLTQAECIDLDFMYEDRGGIKEYLKSLIKEIQDKGESAPKRPMYEFLKLIIRLSVGKKSDDGKRFVKNESVSNDFLQTEAYSEFIMGLLNDPDGIPDFIAQVLPEVSEDQKNAARAELEKEGIAIPEK